MDDLAARIDSIVAAVKAPGTEITAELRGRDNLTVSFGEGIYEFVSERVLKAELERIARLLWSKWQREYHAAVSEAGLEPEMTDLRDRNFLAERDTVAATGTSPDGSITIGTAGLKEFNLSFPGELTRRISANEFSSAVGYAARELINDFRKQVSELKKRYYE